MSYTLPEVFFASDWKETVPSFVDLAIQYPFPQEGWVASVADTDIVYRYNSVTATWEVLNGFVSTQDIWETFAADAGSTTANSPTDTLNILGSGNISTAIVGDTLTISLSEGVGSGLDADTLDGISSDGFVQTTGNQTVAGNKTFTGITQLDQTNIVDNEIILNFGEVGAGVTAVEAGIRVDRGSLTDAVIHWDESAGEWQAGVEGSEVRLIQYLWETVTGDSGSTTANTTTDTLSIVGFGDVSTAVVGDTLTISSTAVGVPTGTSGSVAFWNLAGTNITEDNANLYFDDTNNRFGVGINTGLTARVDIKESTLGNKLLQLQTSSGGAFGDINYQITQHRTTTTNNTAATLASITTTSNVHYLVEARVIGARTGGTSGTAGDAATYIRYAKYKNDAGTLTVSVVQTEYTAEDQAAWNCTLVVSGTNIIVEIMGANNNNVEWQGTVRIQRVNFV